mgnify:CR=1 FL=1
MSFRFSTLAAAVALCGLALGLPAAWLLTRLLTGWLFGVTATDPLTFRKSRRFSFLMMFSMCYLPLRPFSRPT